MSDLPEPTDEHSALAAAMYRQALTGWHDGTEETLRQFGAFSAAPGRTVPDDVWVAMILIRDKIPGARGWWHNDPEEFCWHLVLSARPARQMRLRELGVQTPAPRIDLPAAEERYWGSLFFQEHVDKVWSEPSRVAGRPESGVHLRLFLDPATMQPYLPQGDPHPLARWLTCPHCCPIPAVA